MDQPLKKYRAVDSNGREFEVELLKNSRSGEPVQFARAPEGDGRARVQSRPAAKQGGAR